MRAYFAYGSDLWRQQMNERCPGHRVLGMGILTGYRWIINIRGHATLVQSVHDLVFGVIYGIPESGEERLDQCSGVQAGHYRKVTLPVMTGRGDLRCLVYLDPLEQEGEPEEEYAGRIRNGIRDAKLPPMYVDRYLEKVTSWSGSWAACG